MPRANELENLCFSLRKWRQLLPPFCFCRHTGEPNVRAHPSLTERLRDEHGKLRPHLALFINEDDARLLGWEDAPLHDGDIVHVIPAVSGG